jgi:tryptophanyl-tRNA synthetase
MVADYQALTTHGDRTREIEENVREIVLDYLSAGFDPERGVCFLQSHVPQLAELTTIFGNLVTLPRLLRNPTIREEMREMSLSDRATYGFVGYPVSQAADILLFRPALAPVGPDQQPHIELAQEVAARFNRLYGPVFPIPEAMLGDRLIGTDGRRKMGKSYGNAIDLADPPETVREKVQGMVTDPARARRSDPGHPEVCPVFSYHRTLSPDAETAVAGPCRRAKIGCADCKRNLAVRLNDFLDPLRERRAYYERQPGLIRDILNMGGAEARVEGQRTLEEVKEAMGLSYKRLLA